jgi:hypothetical protein|nr:MAG TPA_asm: hypothetical protein [Caudoviricetes sp.]
MDAVKFIEERNRMCNFHYHAGECCECPAKDFECNSLLDMGDDCRIVSVIEEWSAAHPRKTRQSVFLEQWPEAMVESDGVIAICPTALDKSYGKTHCTHILTKAGCDSCRSKFWGEVVE